MTDKPKTLADAAPSYQARVKPWLDACFGPEIAGDKTERNHRFLEEALELVQSGGCTASEAHQLVDYVYGRPVGEMGQEVGGVMNTLAALCLAYGRDMHEDGETELARVWTMAEKIRAKQAAKPKHSPLPGYAAATPALGWRAMQDGDIRVRGMRTVTGFDTCVYCGGIGSVVDEEPSAMEAFDNQQMSQQIADEHQALEDLCVAHGMTPGGLCMEWLDATLSAGLDAAMKLAVLKQRVDVELNRASQRLAAAETHEDSNNANVWGAVVSAMHRLRRVGKWSPQLSSLSS